MNRKELKKILERHVGRAEESTKRADKIMQNIERINKEIQSLL